MEASRTEQRSVIRGVVAGWRITSYNLNQQLRHHSQHRPGLGQSLTQRLHCGAMLRGDRKMQRIAGAESECMLVDEFCRRPGV